jgi:hypothetical protein
MAVARVVAVVVLEALAVLAVVELALHTHQAAQPQERLIQAVAVVVGLTVGLPLPLAVQA